MGHASVELSASPQKTVDWVVIRLSALGDLALVTGVLDYWYKTRGWTFAVVTKEANAPVFAEHPAVREIISLRDEDMPLFRLVLFFRSLALQYANCGLLDLHGTLRTRLLGLLWKGSVRRYRKCGLARRLFLLSGGRWFGAFLRQWNVPQRYALALESSPPERTALLPSLPLTASESAQGRHLLATLLEMNPCDAEVVPDRQLVALHPYATHPGKAWNSACWQTLLALLDEKKIPWFVVGRGTPLPGVPAERDFTNKTSLRETCALLQTATVLVTGDSGPMHLAAGVGTPVVALFGPTTQEWGFFPAGPKDRVLEAAFPCRPCSLHGKQTCPHEQACMRAITPDQVLAALEDVSVAELSR